VERSEFEALKKMMDVLTVVTAAGIGDHLPLRERAPLLHGLGLDRTQIARVCGTSPEVVSVRLAEAKRVGKKGGKKGANQAQIERSTDERQD
jgi:hypothetical protein